MPEPGDLLLERFRVEALLGKGGMGHVYGARQLRDGQPVAIKVLSLDMSLQRESVPRFLNEARATMKLESPHAVRVFEVGTLDIGVPFLVMELLEGSDLAALLQRRGTLPIAEAIDYVIQSADAIAEAHKHGIVHRDLKPSNLFLTSAATRGTRNIIKVLDFGISKMAGDGINSGSGATALTTTGTLLGSPHYMSPEQLKNARDVDGRADVWSLGVILYELLAGKGPFEGGSFGAVFTRIMTADFVELGKVRPNVPPELDQAIGRCLTRGREERYPDAAALVRGLAPFASPDGIARAQRIAGPFDCVPIRPPSSRNLASTALMANRPNVFGAHGARTPADARRVLSAPYQRDIATIASGHRPPSSGRLPAPAPAPAPAPVAAPVPAAAPAVGTPHALGTTQALPSSAAAHSRRTPPGSNRGPWAVPATTAPAKRSSAPFVVGAALAVALVGTVLIVVALRARGHTTDGATPPALSTSPSDARAALPVTPASSPTAPPAPSVAPEPAPSDSAVLEPAPSEPAPSEPAPSEGTASAPHPPPAPPAILNKRK